MPYPILKLSGVSKGFASKSVICDLSFEFHVGLTTILGANGCGKSTLLAIMAGTLPYDKGSIWVNQYELHKSPVPAKKLLSYLPDKTLFYPFIKGYEFLHLIASIKKASLKHPTVDYFIHAFNLEPHMYTALKDMSLGTQKKFMIVAAMIGDPSILIMDEPTNALEKTSKALLIQYLQEQIHNKVMIVATHDQDIINRFTPSIVLTKEQNKLVINRALMEDHEIKRIY